MGDIAEVFPIAHPPGSFPLFQATTDVSARSQVSVGGKPVPRTSPIDEEDFLCESSLSRISRAAERGHSRIITHGLGERIDISPGAGAQRGGHQEVDVYHRGLLISVIEPGGRVHDPLLFVGMQKMDGEW